MKAKYCKKQNTYTIKECKECDCPEYWKQGIGATIGQNDLHSFNDDFDI